MLSFFLLPVLRRSLFCTGVFMKLVEAGYTWGFYPLVDGICLANKDIQKQYLSGGLPTCESICSFPLGKKVKNLCGKHFIFDSATHSYPKQNGGMLCFLVTQGIGA